jgi:two-component system cell cycle response regulator DivK
MTNYALIIDDNALNLDSLAVLLKREGFTAISLQSTRTLDSVLHDAPDIKVVFLDLELPNDNGFDILDTLRQDERVKGVPIVAYTVHTSVQNEARDAGFHSFIGKPLDVHRFPDQLNRILNGEPVWEVG